MKLSKMFVALFLSLLTACGGCVLGQSRVSRTDSADSVYKVSLSMVVDASSLGLDDHMKMGLSGTGWVAAKENGVSYIMTAGHVCNGDAAITGDSIFTGPYVLPIIERSYTLIGKDDQRITGITVALDDDTAGTDSCILVTMGDFGPPLPIGDDDPEYGTHGWYVGAPHGAWGGGIAGIYEVTAMGRGQIFGDGHDALAFSSAEAAPGASGSPIFFNGRVIAMLTLGMRGFGTITTGIPHETLKRVVSRARHLKPITGD